LRNGGWAKARPEGPRSSEARRADYIVRPERGKGSWEVEVPLPTS